MQGLSILECRLGRLVVMFLISIVNCCGERSACMVLTVMLWCVRFLVTLAVKVFVSLGSVPIGSLLMLTLTSSGVSTLLLLGC